MSAAAHWLGRYPFLRFDIPLIIGIALVNAGVIFHERTLLVIMTGSVLFLLVSVCRKGGHVTFRHRWVFGAVLALLLFCLGAWRAGNRHREVRMEWSEAEQPYRGWVSGIPEEKKKSRMVPVEVDGKQVLLYLPKDSLSASLACGDEVLFYARIRPPHNWGDIGFDYAAYLRHQGISGTAFSAAGRWMKGKARRALTWKQQALLLREKLVDRYRMWGFEGDELSVIAALTLGDKSELDADLKQSYSTSGASHILALSGLHLNMVAGVLSMLLLFRLGRGWSRWVRGILIVGALWAYAYITGLSGSVVRSAVMFTVFIAGRCLERNGLSLNTLSMAAFAMLLYNPFYLFDVGFLLSFLAVAGIVLLTPVFRHWMFLKRFRASRYVQDLFWVSMAAQLGVAPLVVYYFDSFPSYFLLTNLVVVPLSGIILVVSLALWLVGWWPAVHGFMAVQLRFLLQLMNDVVVGVSHLPGASLRLSFSALDVLLFYWVLACLLVFYYHRSVRMLSVMLIGVCICLGMNFFIVS